MTLGLKSKPPLQPTILLYSQTRECDKLLDSIKSAFKLDMEIKAKKSAKGDDTDIDNETKIREQVLLRTVKNELAYYLRTYRDVQGNDHANITGEVPKSKFSHISFYNRK